MKWLRPLVARALSPAAAAAALVGPASLVVLAASAPGITLNPNYGPPGTTTKVVGHGFCVAPCTPVAFKVGLITVAGSVTVAANGSFSTCIEIPGTVRPPSANVTASQRDQNGALVSASATFMVTPNAPPSAQCSPAPTTPPVGPSPTPRTSPSTTPRPSPSPSSSPAGPTPASPGPATPLTPNDGAAGTPSASALWIAIAIAVAAVVGVAAYFWWRRASARGS